MKIKLDITVRLAKETLALLALIPRLEKDLPSSDEANVEKVEAEPPVPELPKKRATKKKKEETATEEPKQEEPPTAPSGEVKTPVFKEPEAAKEAAKASPMEAFGTAEPEKPEKAKVSRDDIRFFLGRILKDEPHKHAAMLKIFEEYGAKTVSELPTDYLSEILEKLEKEADK